MENSLCKKRRELKSEWEKKAERERRERDKVSLFGQEEGKMSFPVRSSMTLKTSITGKIVSNQKLHYHTSLSFLLLYLSV